jgi:hypothetical protein
MEGGIRRGYSGEYSLSSSKEAKVWKLSRRTIASETAANIVFIASINRIRV